MHSHQRSKVPGPPFQVEVGVTIYAMEQGRHICLVSTAILLLMLESVSLTLDMYHFPGLALGGLLGVREGFARPLGVDSPTYRLRLNAVLNQVTRRGSFFGNSAGVIALIYNIVDASIDAARGKHDMAGSIAAGGLSGALFKCTGEWI